MAGFRGFTYAFAFLLLAVVIRAHTDSTKVSSVPLPYANGGYEHTQESQNQETQNSHGSYVPEGYHLPSGYESYLVPAVSQEYGHEKPSFGLISAAYEHIEPFISSMGSVLPKVAIGAFVLVALLVVGTLLTSCVCAYTPLCHMTFMGVNLTPERFRGFMTQDRISELTSFVQTAIKKYHDMNSKKSVNSSIDSNEVK